MVVTGRPVSCMAAFTSSSWLSAYLQRSPSRYCHGASSTPSNPHCFKQRNCSPMDVRPARLAWHAIFILTSCIAYAEFHSGRRVVRDPRVGIDQLLEWYDRPHDFLPVQLACGKQGKAGCVDAVVI